MQIFLSNYVGTLIMFIRQITLELYDKTIQNTFLFVEEYLTHIIYIIQFLVYVCRVIPS